jgi:MFS family permease
MITKKELLNVSVAMAGLSFCWGCQYARASAVFQHMGMDSRFLGLVWIAGPISGALVAPLVGMLSDRMGGKRKPWIAGGLLFILASFLLFAFSSSLPAKTDLLCAVVAFWLADFAINAAQAPLRTLLVDIAPPEQQAEGSAWFSVMQGIGNVAAYALGGARLGRFIPLLAPDYLGEFLGDVRVLYLIGVVIVSITVVWTLLTVSEGSHYVALEYDASKDRYQNSSGVSTVSSSSQLKDWMESSFPVGLRKICLVQLFVWYGWFCFFVYILPYAGSEVFNGDPNPELPDSSPAKSAYNQAVFLVNKTQAANSLIALLFSFALPRLIQASSFGFVYSSLVTFQSILTLLLFLVRSKTCLAIVVCLLGFPWAGVLVIPYALAGQACNSSDSKGLQMAILNIFICIPQVLVSLTTGSFIHFADDDLSVVFLVGTVTQIIGAVLSWIYLRNPSSASQSEHMFTIESPSSENLSSIPSPSS